VRRRTKFISSSSRPSGNPGSNRGQIGRAVRPAPGRTRSSAANRAFDSTSKSSTSIGKLLCRSSGYVARPEAQQSAIAVLSALTVRAGPFIVSSLAVEL